MFNRKTEHGLQEASCHGGRGFSKFSDARTPGGLPGLYEYTALNGTSASKASGFPSRVQALHEQELGITGMRYFGISGVRDSSSFRILRKVN